MGVHKKEKTSIGKGQHANEMSQLDFCFFHEFSFISSLVRDCVEIFIHR